MQMHTAPSDLDDLTAGGHDAGGRRGGHAASVYTTKYADRTRDREDRVGAEPKEARQKHGVIVRHPRLAQVRDYHAAGPPRRHPTQDGRAGRRRPRERVRRRDENDWSYGWGDDKTRTDD